MEYKLIKRYDSYKRDWQYIIKAEVPPDIGYLTAIPDVLIPRTTSGMTSESESDIMFRQRAIAVFDEFIKDKRFVASQIDEVVKTEVV